MEYNHIYQGNCFDLFNMLDDNSVDYTFTSPPYNRKRNDKYKLYDDTISDYYGFLLNAINQSLRVTKNIVFFNLQINYYNSQDIYQLMGTYASLIKNLFIWEKTNPMPASGYNITNSYEIIIALGKSPLKSNFTYTKNILHTSVNSNMPKNHKAVMKPEVAEFFIKNFTKENDIILDPFMGLGTTAITCKKLNRKYIGFELVEEYCNEAKERLK